MEQLTLRLAVQCTELPGLLLTTPAEVPPSTKTPVYLGLQRGQEVIEQVPADRREAWFYPEFRLGKQADGSPNFLGPFAQGTTADRFFYLSWGIKGTDGTFDMFRRLKVRLGHLTWAQITAATSAAQPIQVTLRLTDKKGQPLCATPPPSHLTWHLADLG